MISHKVYEPLSQAQLKDVAADRDLYDLYLDGLMYLHDALSGFTETHGPSRFGEEALSYCEERVLAPLSDTYPAVSETFRTNYSYTRDLVQAFAPNEAGTLRYSISQEAENFLDMLMDEYRALRTEHRIVSQ